MKILIAGCGYMGVCLGEKLARQGHEVLGARRGDSEFDRLKAAGIHPLQTDITEPSDRAKLPAACDAVIFCASSSKGGEEAYRNIYLKGNRNLCDYALKAGVKKYIYLGSTGVYGQTDGNWVSETSPTQPKALTGRILVLAEGLVLNAFRQTGLPALILRSAGIYGPGRGYFFKKFLANEARMRGDGTRILNMIHRDDLAGCLAAMLESGRPGEIYNAVDDEPVMEKIFYRWLAESVGKWMPLAGKEEDAAESKRGYTNKKISNRKLKMETGCEFKFPTFRQGYTEELRRLEREGKLNIVLEDRSSIETE